MNGDSRQNPASPTASLLLGSLEILQNELGAIGCEIISLLRSAGITPSHNADGVGEHPIPESKRTLN